ncbi:MAG: beta-N-acetylhexosaminidase [Clostridiales bacterium]|nr:beta-N-acetylhexosaminidase [Clostridiales bacterium]
MKRFGVMLDMSRNAVMKVEEVKKLTKILRSFGYTTVMLYTEDTYEVENEPYFGYMRGRYTKQELKEIVAYCESIGMETIPCIQTLAHLNQIFRWSIYSAVHDCDDILLVGEERTYELIENMFKTVRKCFSSEYIHIGMDEAHNVGLGQYLSKNGYEKSSEILQKHLKRVVEIAKKYSFKPLIWSDMFYKLATKGGYYELNAEVTEEIKALVPNDVSLVYWDYYNTESETFDALIKGHQEFNNEIWFAGGAWAWEGFAPHNAYTLKTMSPAMQSVKEYGVENIFITSWGDNGKECSFYAVLPSLYTVKRLYDGETDIQKIKAEFCALTGEDYDALFALDLPNFVGNAQGVENPCKHMLYSDPFNGFLDSTVKEGVSKEYANHAKMLAKYAKTSKYVYLFENASALCELLSVKYAIGLETRAVYAKKNTQQLTALIEKYKLCEELLEKFYQAYRKLWFIENKPHGFDVQDLRLGGLSRRLRSCRERLEKYLLGEENEIPELEEKLLDYFGGEDTFDKEKTPSLNNWAKTASVNII